MVLAMCLLVAPALLAADGPAPPASPESIEHFEKHVRPLLVEHCQKCHGAKKQEGELRLDSRAALLKGGEHGAVVVPGSPGESRLIAAIGYADEDLQMPPDSRLPAAAVALIADWVRQGAPWPDSDTPSADQPGAVIAAAWKNHWAAQPVRPQEPPAVRNAGWIASPVDSFILARLEQNDLAPSPPADRRTLLRRATFDLIGLPPTLDEIAAFEQDIAPGAFERVIDRLLASPHYGERWGRHWLDVARYADTKEYVRLKEERRLLFAFTYRDYVTRAFNTDLPYDQFVLEQLAADLLPASDDHHALAAMGFLTLGRQFTGNPHDIIDDRIDVTSRGLLGLTVTCARCHDHKFDPIPTADYYSLYGIFDSGEVPAVPPLIEGAPADPLDAEQKEIRAREAALNKYQQHAPPAAAPRIAVQRRGVSGRSTRGTQPIPGATSRQSGRSAAFRGRALVGLPGSRRACQRARPCPLARVDGDRSQGRLCQPLGGDFGRARRSRRIGSDRPAAQFARAFGPRARATVFDDRRGSRLW